MKAMNGYFAFEAAEIGDPHRVPPNMPSIFCSC